MTKASGQSLSITIELGKLTWAGTAVPGYYYVQDPDTRELHQVMVSRPAPWPRRIQVALRRAWSGTRWMKPATGVAVALVVLGAAGVAQDFRARADAERQRALVQAIPFAPAPERAAKADLTMLPLPYADETATRPAALPEREERPLPPSVVAAAREARKPAESAPPPHTAAPAQVASAKQLPRQDSTADRRGDRLAKESEKGEASPVIVNEDRNTRGAEAVAAAPRGVAAQSPKPAGGTGEGGAASAPDIGRPTRLVAIQDAQTILVTSPTTRLPARVSVGAALPGGRKLTAVDMAKGMATLDDGSSLRLE